MSIIEIQDFYESNKIFESSKVLIFKDIDKSNKNPVILKMTATDLPTKEELERIEYKYQFLKEYLKQLILFFMVIVLFWYCQG